MNKVKDNADEAVQKIIHNCHTHSFVTDHVPNWFLKFIPISLLRAFHLLKPLAHFLHWLGRWKYFATMNHYATYLGISGRQKQEEVFTYMQGFYPRETRFAILSMDFEGMKRGNPYIPYLKQLEELAGLKKKYKELILPFICIDPRRNKILELTKEYIEQHNFSGIKLYPSLGYFPDDVRLFPVYQYAEENNIPITTHCIPVNAVYYSGKITGEMLSKAKSIDPAAKKNSNFKFARYFNHPLNYLNVLKEFPELKINIAHFGGNTEWDSYLDESWNSMAQVTKEKSWFAIIRDDIIGSGKYDNVYTDISFTVYDSKLFPLLKSTLKNDHVRKKILFGSDFYMLEKNRTERRFSYDVRGYLDEKDYWQIAELNPKKFLNLV